MVDTVSSLYTQIGPPYRPSVAVDLEAGRQTEGEHTIGHLVRCADQHGLKVLLLRAARSVTCVLLGNNLSVLL